jgi:hypothetical protein
VLGRQLAVVLQALQIAARAEDAVAPVMTTLRTSALDSATLRASTPAAYISGPEGVAKLRVAEGQDEGLTFAGAEKLCGHFFSISWVQS